MAATRSMVNPDLDEERKRCDFNVQAFSTFLYGEDGMQMRREIDAILKSTPELAEDENVDFLDREQRYEHAMRKTVALVHYAEKAGIGNDPHMMHMLRESVLGLETSPLQLHSSMFMATMNGQTTEEQKQKWLPKALSLQMVGCYAQTELGHGSNIRKLETTATYDPSREEFVVNSPTLSSIKWWPGNLGKSANHAIVYAQLYSKGKCHGLHPFLVQLRDYKTHEPMPGIVVGDIGPKLVMVSNDNGFLQLNNVRIPRENMLMKFSSVLKDGTYVPPIHQKLGYGTMMLIRSMMVQNFALVLAKASTIATRYSCVRRQGEINPNEGEVKIIDYRLQQYKLFPYVASAYAFWFVGDYIRKLYFNVTKDVENPANMALLPELHIMSSGLKAFVTWEVVHGTEILRLSCGGHGHSLASNLSQLYEASTAACTYEGENTVLYLQVARYLFKRAKQEVGKRSVLPTAPLHRNVSNGDLAAVYQRADQRAIDYAVRRVDQLVARGRSEEEAWNECSVSLIHAAKADVHLFIVKSFFETVEQARRDGVDGNIVRVLEHLSRLYALFGIVKRSGNFFETGFFGAQQVEFCQDAFSETLQALRLNAVGLVDAFQFTDRDLHSVLGRYDGQVYEHLFEWAKSSPLNKKQVLDCHHKYLGKTISEQSKL